MPYCLYIIIHYTTSEAKQYDYSVAITNTILFIFICNNMDGMVYFNSLDDSCVCVWVGWVEWVQL